MPEKLAGNLVGEFSENGLNNLDRDSPSGLVGSAGSPDFSGSTRLTEPLLTFPPKHRNILPSQITDEGWVLVTPISQGGRHPVRMPPHVFPMQDRG